MGEKRREEARPCIARFKNWHTGVKTLKMQDEIKADCQKMQVICNEPEHGPVPKEKKCLNRAIEKCMKKENCKSLLDTKEKDDNSEDVKLRRHFYSCTIQIKAEKYDGKVYEAEFNDADD